MTKDDIIRMAREAGLSDGVAETIPFEFRQPGEQVLLVTAEGEFIWHKDAESMIKHGDFSNSQSLRFILQRLWSQGGDMNEFNHDKGYQEGRQDAEDAHKEFVEPMTDLLNTAMASLNEITDMKNAENERLKAICRAVYEVWAGSEGIPMPETAAEGYLLMLVEAMRDEAKEGLK